MSRPSKDSVVKLMLLQQSSNQKTVTVINTIKHVKVESLLDRYALRANLDVIEVDAAYIDSYVHLNNLNHLIACNNFSFMQRSIDEPTLFVITGIQRASASGRVILEAIIRSVYYNTPNWLYPGSQVVFLDYSSEWTQRLPIIGDILSPAARERCNFISYKK